MILSAIAGWLVIRIWPTGFMVVFATSAFSALFQRYNQETANSYPEIAGATASPNGFGVLLMGFALDIVINFIVFCIVWFIRSKVKPHSIRNQAAEEKK